MDPIICWEPLQASCWSQAWVHDAHTLVKGQWTEFIKERDGVVKLLRTKYDALYKNTALKDDLPAD